MKLTLIAASFLTAVGAGPTPSVTELTVSAPSAGIVFRGFAAEIDATTRVGVAVICDRRTGALRAMMSFGAFPYGRPVQPAVRGPSGNVARFGDVVTSDSGPRAGFHAPMITDLARVRQLIDMAFRNGSLVSNGWQSVRNLAPDGDNAAARRDLLDCAAGG